MVNGGVNNILLGNPLSRRQIRKLWDPALDLVAEPKLTDPPELPSPHYSEPGVNTGLSSQSDTYGVHMSIICPPILGS